MMIQIFHNKEFTLSKSAYHIFVPIFTSSLSTCDIISRTRSRSNNRAANESGIITTLFFIGFILTADVDFQKILLIGYNSIPSVLRKLYSNSQSYIYYTSENFDSELEDEEAVLLISRRVSTFKRDILNKINSR